LIVDDEDQLRAVLKEILRWKATKWLKRLDGRAAMEAQRLQGFDLVITDIIMPEMERY
jgi:YesN/AraC family two-component response regulator